MKEAPDNATQEPRAAGTPARSLPDFVDTYYAGCTMVVSSPVDICVYFGRYTLKDLETGRPGLVQIFEKQVYLTPEEAERVGQAILKTVQVFKAAQRGELKTGMSKASGTQSVESDPLSSGRDDLIKV
jgi:hypothetical protein|uniref:DUF3467 domain-containing protein n=1 Tax=Desulfomonile tiedjei TaxID=2358 RepID=A0A7C4ETB4_9BACT